MSQWYQRRCWKLIFLSLVRSAKSENGQTCWTKFWKGTTKGRFHQTLVQNVSIVSEELFKMWKVHNDDRRKVMKIAHMTLLVRWAINIWYRTLRFKYYYSTSKILKKKLKKKYSKGKKPTPWKINPNNKKKILFIIQKIVVKYNTVIPLYNEKRSYMREGLSWGVQISNILY